MKGMCYAKRIKDKSVPSNRGFGINAKKYQHKGVILSTALYGAEAWGMRGADGRKLNVLATNCWRSLRTVGLLGRPRLG